tara:strand:- start:59 stop:649 length:591 start_codon:yes stop_codon:yes gene_type:complete
MPNWCTQTIECFTEDDERVSVKPVLDSLRGEDNKYSFNNIIPMPEELKNSKADFKVNQAMVDKYGFSNWYDWSCAKWGTKWDVAEISKHGKKRGGPFKNQPMKMSCQTAWQPACPVWRKISELNPTIKIHLQYVDECIGNGYGEDIYLNGELISERFSDDIQDDNCKDIIEDIYGKEFVEEMIQEIKEYEEEENDD